MPLIIAATDFSEVGENAVDYACALATAHKASVTVIHSFIIPVMFSDIPMPGSLLTDAQNDAEDRLKETVSRMAEKYPGITVNGNVIYGNTIDALDDNIDDTTTPWMIVVGNSLRTGGNWPDSVLMDAFRKLAYPVVAVPPGYSYKSVANICFAFDNRHTGNDAALNQVITMVQDTNAKLHVLNVQPGAGGDSSMQAIDADAKNKLAAVNPQYHFVQTTENVDTAIHDFVANNNIDWLIMIPRPHSFFEGLFHKSHTKSVTHDSAVPIMAVHEAG